MICSGHGGILINFNIASQLGGPAAQCLEVDQHRKRAGYPTGCINRSKPSTSRQSLGLKMFLVHGISSFFRRVQMYHIDNIYP